MGAGADSLVTFLVTRGGTLCGRPAVSTLCVVRLCEWGAARTASVLSCVSITQCQEQSCSCISCRLSSRAPSRDASACCVQRQNSVSSGNSRKCCLAEAAQARKQWWWGQACRPREHRRKKPARPRRSLHWCATAMATIVLPIPQGGRWSRRVQWALQTLVLRVKSGLEEKGLKDIREART